MNFCPNCGGELTPGLKYCPVCGCMLSENASDPLPEKEIFPEDGAKNSQDNVFENIGGSASSDSVYNDRTDNVSDSGNGYTQTDSAVTYSSSSPTDTYTTYESSDTYVTTSTNGFAIASLVLGIIALFLDVLLFIPSILAIVFGIIGLKNVERCNSGRGIAIAGIILAIIAAAILIILILLAFIFTGTIASIAL